MLDEEPKRLDGWDVEYGPNVHNEYVPDSIDLGLYYSPNKEQVQVAKIPQKDRATHMYVVGATGTGKTKFLEFLIWQDIANNNGFGVIDPHGDLIEDIKGILASRYLEDMDREIIEDRVILVDPTDDNYTVTFNPLEAIDGVSVAEQAGELVSSFKKIWADSWGSRMEDLMRSTLIALGEAGLTLCEIPVFLTHRQFRKVVMESVTNPTTIDYFHRFDTLTDRAQVTWIEPVMNKVNAFLADDRMRQIFSSPTSSFHLQDIMDTGKQLLIKLDKGKLKGSADLLGSLFMAKIQMSAFSRSNIPAHKRKPFYLYIDEFQNFATDSFEVILSEARKYGLSLVMAHQSLSQIPDSLRGLILSSAGIQVFFRVNRHDAQLLAKEVFSYSGFEVKSEGVSRPVYWSYAEEWEHKIGDLQSLEPRMCYANHKIQGGAIELMTAGLPTPWEMLGVDEEEYFSYLSILPIGGKYRRPRKELANETNLRRCSIEERIGNEAKVEESPPEVIPAVGKEIVESKLVQITVPPEPPPNKITKIIPPPEYDPQIEREHRRLQHLIKQLAEQCGYLSTIEQPTDDGQGRIDVALKRDDERIACEVSVTTSPEHELQNIQKCLASGYGRVIFCASDKKSVQKVKALCTAELPEAELTKVGFFDPTEVALLFEEEAAKNAGKVDRVKGYKVKVNFQPQLESDKQMKRQSIAQIVLKSFRRDKQKE